MAAVVLALDRCLLMSSRHWSSVFFEGVRTWLWIVGLCLYSLYFLVFTKPTAFSAIYVAWLYNVHAGYFEDPNGTVSTLSSAA